MELLALFILGWWLGANHATYIIRKQIHKMAKESGVLVEQDESPRAIPELILEKHNNTYYLFDKKTDTFLCQSNDLNDLGKKLVEYKNIKLAIVMNGQSSFWFVNGNVSSSPQ
jgi:hypothetical protein